MFKYFTSMFCFLFNVNLHKLNQVFKKLGEFRELKKFKEIIEFRVFKEFRELKQFKEVIMSSGS